MNPIRQFRKKHKLSQRKLAQVLGVNERTVQRWESGERNPRPIVIKMLEVLPVQPQTEKFSDTKIKKGEV